MKQLKVKKRVDVYVITGAPDYDTSTYEGDYSEKSEYGDYNSTYYDYLNDAPWYEEEKDYCISFLFTARILYSQNANPLLGLTIPPSPGELFFPILVTIF